jgi:hypothetical protein
VKTRGHTLLAFFLYLAASISIFGSRVLFSPLHTYIGIHSDPSFFIWNMAWWPYALGHHLNPFLAKVIWSPHGVNMAWVAGVPGPALLFSPITYYFGPIASYNFLLLTAPAFGAWTAFLVCQYISRSFWPSLVGGYIFGFSSYEQGQMLGHSHLAIIVCIPLLLLLFLLALDRKISRWYLYLGLTGVLTFQFLTSTEVFATISLFGSLSYAAAFWMFPTRRSELIDLIIPLIAAYGSALVLMAPYLYYALAFGLPPIFNSPFVFSMDALNPIVPVHNWLDQLPLASFRGRFQGNVLENGGYFGIPLLACLATYAVRHRREPSCKFLAILFIAALILALGPFLVVCGRTYRLPLPWLVALFIPALNQALPVRMTLYAFLAAAAMSSLYLSKLRSGTQAVWSVLILVVLLPQLPWPTIRADTPAFFTTGIYKQYLNPRERILILPFAGLGNSMLWQAQTNMYFDMVGGNVSSRPPQAAERWPIVRALLSATDIPGAGLQLKALLRTHRVNAVIVAYQSERVWNGQIGSADESARVVDWDWSALLSQLGVPPIRTGGVSLYLLRPETVAAYPKGTPREMEALAASGEFATLVSAARQYLALTGKPDGLTLLAAAKLHLIPATWVSWADEKHPNATKELALDTRNGLILIAIRGVASGLRGIYERYRPFAVASHFVSTNVSVAVPPADDDVGNLVMSFSPQGILRAAAVARGASQQSSNDTDTARPHSDSH